MKMDNPSSKSNEIEILGEVINSIFFIINCDGTPFNLYLGVDK